MERNHLKEMPGFKPLTKEKDELIKMTLSRDTHVVQYQTKFAKKKYYTELSLENKTL